MAAISDSGPDRQGAATKLGGDTDCLRRARHREPREDDLEHRPEEEGMKKLHELLKVPRGLDGFFMERNAKLGPVDGCIPWE